MSEADDLALARWEVAILNGRLRCLEAERDAALRDRDRSHEVVHRIRASRAYRIGLRLAELRRDPVRTARSVLRRRQLMPKNPHKSGKKAPPPLPARVYVAVGLTDTDSHTLVRTLRQRILVDADHLPVVVTDQPALRGMQLPGVVLEYLPDPHTWELHDPGEEWESLLSGRIAHLCRDYGVVATVVVDPRNPPTLAKLLSPVTPV